MLDSLEELGKFNLLMSISLAIIEKLFISLIIPAIQPNVINLVVHILIHAQSIQIFKKINPRIVKVLTQMNSNMNLPSIEDRLEVERRFDLMIDIIYALLDKFAPYIENHEATVNVLLL